jgi:hypothetical protein
MVHLWCAESVHDVENAVNKSIGFGVHSSVHIKMTGDMTSQPLQS